jgi:hypothetical protein
LAYDHVWPLCPLWAPARLTLLIPIKIRLRGSNKVITLPNGETGKPQRPVEPTPMQLALARGHRWLAMLESGEVKSLTEIANREVWITVT